MKISVYDGCTSFNINVEGVDFNKLSKEEKSRILTQLIENSEIFEEENEYVLKNIVSTLMYKIRNRNEESTYCETCDSNNSYAEVDI